MASITINFSNEDGVRLADALGYDGPLDAAALQFLKDDVIRRYRNVVVEYEHRQNEEAFLASHSNVDLT